MLEVKYKHVRKSCSLGHVLTYYPQDLAWPSLNIDEEASYISRSADYIYTFLKPFLCLSYHVLSE